MGRPISLAIIEDLAIGASGLDILREQADALLQEPSLVVVHENRESVDVTTQIKVGSEEVKPLGPSAINATVGDMPILPDDRTVVTLGNAGERVQILGTNANAAAQEARAVVQIFSIADVSNFPALASNL